MVKVFFLMSIAVCYMDRGGYIVFFRINSLYPIMSIMIVGVMLLALISIVYMSWNNGISPMPSSAQVRHAVANEVNRISKKGTIVDAGSGFGTLVMHMSMHCPDWKIVGIENSLVPLWISRLYLRFIVAVKGNFLGNVMFINDNIYTYPYAEVDVIVCYLYPGAMKQLDRMAHNRLSPGTRIISICFALPGWEPERIVTCRDLYRTKVYVYDL
jgi:hypothetical protein